MKALPLLPEKSIDLCLTDPPFNVKYTGVSSNEARFGGKQDRDYKKDGSIIYNDIKDDYNEWCHQWSDLVKVTCNRYCFFVGRQNIKYWMDNFRDIGVWFKPDSNGRGGTFWFVKHEFFITGGKWGNERMITSVLTHNANSGFLNPRRLVHPCPRPAPLYFQILYESKISSVLDIFMGSGTTAQAAEALGIPWLGFEIMEEYRPDIEKRIQLGIKERGKPKQGRLF